MLLTRRQLQKYLSHLLKESLENMNPRPAPLSYSADTATKTIFIYSPAVLKEFISLLKLGSGYGQYFEHICYSAIPELFNSMIFEDLNKIKNQPFADALEIKDNILYSIKFSQQFSGTDISGVKYDLIPQCMAQAKQTKPGFEQSAYKAGLIKGAVSDMDYFNNKNYQNAGCLPITVSIVAGNDDSPRYGIDANDNLTVTLPSSSSAPTILLKNLFGDDRWITNSAGSDTIYTLTPGQKAKPTKKSIRTYAKFIEKFLLGNKSNEESFKIILSPAFNKDHHDKTIAINNIDSSYFNEYKELVGKYFIDKVDNISNLAASQINIFAGTIKRLYKQIITDVQKTQQKRTKELWQTEINDSTGKVPGIYLAGSRIMGKLDDKQYNYIHIKTDSLFYPKAIKVLAKAIGQELNNIIKLKAANSNLPPNAKEQFDQLIAIINLLWGKIAQNNRNGELWELLEKHRQELIEFVKNAKKADMSLSSSEQDAFNAAKRIILRIPPSAIDKNKKDMSESKSLYLANDLNSILNFFEGYASYLDVLLVCMQNNPNEAINNFRSLVDELSNMTSNSYSENETGQLITGIQFGKTSHGNELPTIDNLNTQKVAESKIYQKILLEILKYSK